MIVVCPRCESRFDLAGRGQRGRRLVVRCHRCRQVFRVEFPGSPASPPISVLLAHSDAPICRSVQDLLDCRDIDTRVCHSGEEVLTQLRQKPAEILLMEVALPGPPLFVMTEKIRQLPSMERAKIILVSSVFSQTAYKRSPESLYGADDFLEAHRLMESLLPKIDLLLSRRKKVADRLPALIRGTACEDPRMKIGLQERKRER